MCLYVVVVAEYIQSVHQYDVTGANLIPSVHFLSSRSVTGSMSAPILPVFIGKSPYLAESVSTLTPFMACSGLSLRFSILLARSGAASGAHDPRRFERKHSCQNVEAVSERTAGCD